MNTEQPQTGTKGKVDLESCRRLVSLAQYRISENDTHEALSVLQQALMLASPSLYGSEYADAIRRLRCEICIALTEQLMKLGRMVKAQQYAEQALNSERSNMVVQGLINTIRQSSPDSFLVRVDPIV